ncbi:MAG: ADP-dependent glucokinase/phosphofructokinase [Candidatus Jordarchaeum sp.]|uniref:ADP-dependent glucokinase/phosphofructokinase n=1 Tax=Candidatus Jordarchaeum sp. TaxID=2823881 RepID=UPI00404A5F0E
MFAEEWTKKYSQALQEVSQCIGLCRMFITGLNTNIDGLIHVSGKEIENIITEKKLANEVIYKLDNPPREIRTFSDVLAGILYCAKTGDGEEWFIRDPQIIEMIKSIFSYDRLRMGGQCGIMTNVLALMNLRVIPNVVELPPLQAEQFTTEIGEVLIPRFEGKEIVFKKPLEAARHGDKVFIHWIFEFDNQFKARINQEIVEAPVENRFIATYDDENVKLKTDPAFREGTLKVISEVGKVILSGYHMLQTSYSDGSKPEDYIKETLELINSWRERNPELRIHSEIGFLADSALRKSVLDMIAPRMDSIGLNEDELADNLYTLGHKNNLRKIRALDAPQIYKGARKIMERYQLSRIMVHTREFSLSLTKSDYGINPIDELYSIIFGSLFAATLAHTGIFPTIRAAEKTLKSGDLVVSEKGLMEHQKLAELLEDEENYPKQKFLKEGFTETEPSIAFTPSKLTEPKATVGMGDTITSASLAGEEALTRRAKKIPT